MARPVRDEAAGARRARIAAALVFVALAGWQIALADLAPSLIALGRFDLVAPPTPGSAMVTYPTGREAMGRGDPRASNAAFRAMLARAAQPIGELLRDRVHDAGLTARSTARRA